MWPLLGDSYLDRLYSGAGPSVARIALSYLERIRRLLTSKNIDLFWINYEVFPYLPSIIESVVRYPGKPIVFDYDDAVFHNYDLHSSPIVRRLLGRKIDKLMRRSTVVFAGNAYLADRASAAGARRVEIVPTVVDVESYAVRVPGLEPVTPRIGWIGTPSTWAAYMEPMMPLIRSVAETYGARVMAVGAGGQAADSQPLLDSLPWSEESEVAMIQQMDIGIMPLADTPWARGKCGYKLIQYMACGLPVVASPVGVNADIVEHGVNGFLASTDAEWREAIGALLADPDLRRRMGAAGREKIERDYSLQVWGPKVAVMLRDVATRSRFI